MVRAHAASRSPAGGLDTPEVSLGVGAPGGDVASCLHAVCGSAARSSSRAATRRTGVRQCWPLLSWSSPLVPQLSKTSADSASPGAAQARRLRTPGRTSGPDTLNQPFLANLGQHGPAQRVRRGIPTVPEARVVQLAQSAQ